MILTGVSECNANIYSFLESHELWGLRAVSKAMKAEVEKTQLYSKDKRIAEYKWNIVRRTNISGTQPTWLHSNGKKLRIMHYDADLLWSVDPNVLSPLQSITLEKVNSWKEVFWNDMEVAIAKPIFPKKRDSYTYTPKSYVTTIFDTENGTNLAQYEHASLFPIAWHNRQLLMREKRMASDIVVNLYAWNVLNNEDHLPEKIFSLRTKSSSEIACQKGKIYCLKYYEKQPFAKLDLQNQCVISLKCQRDWCESSPDNVKNFGVTGAGNIFYSEKRSFVLLNGETSEVITNIVLSILPTNIAFQFPLMACSQQHQFLVYDIRKFDKPVYHHQYLTWRKQLHGVISFQSIIMPALGGDPFSDIKIRAIAFHNNFLFVSKGDDTIDQFDLASSTFSLRNLKFW